VFSRLIPDTVGQWVIGLDVGLTHDRTALALCRGVAGGGVVVQALMTWRGKKGQKVDLVDVQSTVLALARERNAIVVADPFQAVQMAQQLRRAGVPVNDDPFTGRTRREIFGILLMLVRNQCLWSVENADLRRELLGLEVVETPSGWRADHKRTGHDDHVIAVSLAARVLEHLSCECAYWNDEDDDGWSDEGRRDARARFERAAARARLYKRPEEVIAAAAIRVEHAIKTMDPLEGAAEVERIRDELLAGLPELIEDRIERVRGGSGEVTNWPGMGLKRLLKP
jgi:hypothetical protein